MCSLEESTCLVWIVDWVWLLGYSWPCVTGSLQGVFLSSLRDACCIDTCVQTVSVAMFVFVHFLGWQHVPQLGPIYSLDWLLLALWLSDAWSRCRLGLTAVLMKCLSFYLWPEVHNCSVSIPLWCEHYSTTEYCAPSWLTQSPGMYVVSVCVVR